MRLVHLVWGLVFLLSHQLSDDRGVVESKIRNRVQKWQQRTWRARFGSALRKDWKSAFEPAKAHRRSRYGLSPRREDFFTSDRVPNAYSNYHYRRLGDGNTKGQRMKGASGRLRDRGEGKLPLGNRLKRHTREQTALMDYLDPVDLMLLGDDPSGDFIPIQPEFDQQYNLDDMKEAEVLPPVVRAPVGDGDKKLKEFKIVFHHRNLNGSSSRHGVCVSGIAFLIIWALGTKLAHL